jgi:tRNA1(Val) A37 N6-methylase TrmN6
VNLAAPAETTRDLFLGGRFAALQPRRGHHRAGADAILLAAALPPGTMGRVVDLGAGVGVAGLAVAARCAGARVVLVEIDPGLAALARASLALPENAGLADRVSVVEADVTARAAARAAAGLPRGSAETVILNPPYRAPGRSRASPAGGRASAHVLGDGGLEPWLRTAADVLVPGGRVAAIFPAEGLAMLLAALEGRFGAVRLTPIHPRAGEAAIRVVATAVKGRRGGLAIADRLVLHEPGTNAPTPEAREIFAEGAALPGA